MSFLYGLLAEEAAVVPAETAGSIDVAALILKYCFYVAIIIVGLIVLWVLRHRSKLPSHVELKRRVEILSADLDALLIECRDAKMGTYDFFKRISKLLYRTDSLVYVATLLSDKERDGDIGNVAILLENARDCISPYKFRLKTQSEPGGLYDAQEKVADSLAIIQKIIVRDQDLKEEREGKKKK